MSQMVQHGFQWIQMDAVCVQYAHATCVQHDTAIGCGAKIARDDAEDDREPELTWDRRSSVEALEIEIECATFYAKARTGYPRERIELPIEAAQIILKLAKLGMGKTKGRGKGHWDQRRTRRHKLAIVSGVYWARKDKKTFLASGKASDPLESV